MVRMLSISCAKNHYSCIVPLGIRERANLVSPLDVNNTNEITDIDRNYQIQPVFLSVAPAAKCLLFVRKEDWACIVVIHDLLCSMGIFSKGLSPVALNSI